MRELLPNGEIEKDVSLAQCCGMVGEEIYGVTTHLNIGDRAMLPPWVLYTRSTLWILLNFLHQHNIFNYILNQGTQYSDVYFSISTQSMNIF